MKEIQLSQGKVALVDDCDFEWLNQWKWSLSNGYGQRRRLIGINVTYHSITIHRQIMGAKLGF